MARDTQILEGARHTFSASGGFETTVGGETAAPRSGTKEAAAPKEKEKKRRRKKRKATKTSPVSPTADAPAAAPAAEPAAEPTPGTMHVLVYNSKTRCAIVIEGTATVGDMKVKVAKQTNGSWPVERQLLVLRGEALADEMTLAEQGIVDRDRIELQDANVAKAVAGVPDTSAPAAGGSQLDRVLATIDEAATSLDKLALQVDSYEYVHQEYFTRLLETLDNLPLESLSDEERGVVRPRRKALVGRVEQVSAAAGAISSRMK